LKTLPVIISLFQAQQVQGQATVNRFSMSSVDEQSSQATPQQPQPQAQNLIIQ
jgi:hypothetical protein